MKKLLFIIILSLTIFSFSSCATILGGQITSCQTERPKVGENRRQIRPYALAGDILLFPLGIAIDFITKAIYVPCDAVVKERAAKRQIDPIYRTK